MSTPEAKIKAKLDRMLKRFEPDLWYFSPQAGPYGKAGIPDRVVCVAGYFFGIEVKKDGRSKPTALQIKCMSDITKAGGRTFVVYDDATIDKVADLIVVALKIQALNPS
jgi:hypothetical protein